MPRISVIIPSYNHGKYIAEAIRSVLEQTFQDFEIIITDDGSSDKSVDEIRKFSDPRIRLFVFDQNRGACIAANHCIRHATGEYIAMLSSDDAFLPDKLEKQIRFLDENKDYAAVFSNAQVIDEEGNEFKDKNHFYHSIFNQPNRTRYEWLHYFFFNGNCLCHPSALIRRSCYNEIGLYDPRFAQLPDLDFWVKLCFHHTIHILPEKLVRFRIRRDNANVSAVSPKSETRHAWEYYRILHTFLDIATVDDFHAIFPETRKSGTIISPGLIPFFLAKLALGQAGPHHKLFGMQTLFRLLGDDNTVRALQQEVAFTFSDLIALTESCDIFGVKSIWELRNRIAEMEARTNVMTKILNGVFPPSSSRRALIRQMKHKYFIPFLRRLQRR